MKPSQKFVLIAVLSSLFGSLSLAAESPKFVRIAAKEKNERTALAELGVGIDAIRSDSVWSVLDSETIARISREGFAILESHDVDIAFAGQAVRPFDFPAKDGRYHNYSETISMLRSLQSRHADITRLMSIGKTHEQRDIWALQINSNPEALRNGSSGKPGAIFMGAHHAREHLTVEVPLMLAEYLLANRDNPEISRLIETRDIWIIPMVNPDGAEFDISTGKYQYWRKNRRENSDRSYGVDLNRNYGFKWGTGGSSKLPQSDTYMGESPFSEPESQAIKRFVEARPNLKTMLSFHSFSELILYPWGHTYDAIGNARDHAAFDKMAKTMSAWNRYTPQQSSALYIASGDTTDWAYGELGIFAFTFELSPNGNGGYGGFYPGAAAVDKAFSDNLRPCLYLIDLADDPYRAADYVPMK